MADFTSFRSSDIVMSLPEIEHIDTQTQIPIDTSVSLKKRKGSPVWEQFTKLVKNNEDGTAKKKLDGTPLLKAGCKICNKELVYGGRSGTAHLLRHMDGCVRRTASDALQTIIGRTPAGGVYSFTFNNARARKETVRYFICDEIPFAKVEKSAFHRWIKSSFGPQFKPPCRNTVKADVLQFFKDEKLILKDILRKVPGKICFTSDMWTSNQRLGYLVITAHFITSDWKLNKRIISFPMLPSPHSGKSISDAMYANILGWNITDKVGTLTLDNASNNDTAVSFLKQSFFGGDQVSKELFHVRCSAHVLNLIVKDALIHAESSLNNIRESVKHVKASQSKQQKFFESCHSLKMKEKKLPIDVQTRWNSTFLMLESAIPYQHVFELFFYDSEFKYIPSVMDWNNAIVMRDFLKLFYESTKLFSGTNYVTSSTFCYRLSKIACLLEKYSKAPGFKPMYDSMRSKYNKYWKDVPLALGLASCMDPRYKFSILELCLDLNYEHVLQFGFETVINDGVLRITTFKNKLIVLFDEYQRKVNVNLASQAEMTSDPLEEEDPVMALLLKRSEKSVQSCSSNLQRYLDQPTVKVQKGESFNVLEWWKKHECMYPVLSVMARDLLTIPVSTVASESAFSGSERVLSKYRSGLLPETVEALVCLKDWFQAEEGLQDEYLKEMEEEMQGLEL